MNRLAKRVALALIAAAPLSASATHMSIFDIVCDNDTTEENDSTAFVFTDITTVKTTPVKNQNKSGTCWSFTGTGFLENEVLRDGGPALDLSEMFTVRQCYIDKARKYIRTDGNINFAQGGGATDVTYVAEKYGVVPEEVYTGLNYGEDKHMHYEMYDALRGYLEGVKKNASKRLSTAWEPGFVAILDAYLGKVPESFEYDGKRYTPQSFAKHLGLDNSEKYISLTSYTHHPFYTNFALEIPDNWLWAESYNVPLDELKATVDNALENGYSVALAADVSEGGFKWYEGYALLPAEKKEEDMTGSELAKWVKMSSKDRAAKRFEIERPVKEEEITQESRQKNFDNLTSTDDHGMVIVGIAQDQDGKRYYKVKNSWDTNQIYDGYIYVSEPYLLDKTISILVNRKALPKNLAKKL